MTLQYKNAEDTRDIILENLPDKYQKTIGTDFWEWAYAVGKASVTLWDILKYIASWKDLRNLEIEDMARFVYQLRGISHRPATFAVGELTLTGSDTVTEGDIFATKGGLQFKALETKEITESGTVKAECLIAGTIGNVPVSQITEFVSYKGNFTAVTNVAAFSSGYVEETKDELWQRYIDDVANPVTSGNNSHYRKWALDIAGVGKVKIKPLWNGDNTVKVIIIGNDGLTASESLVSAVQNYIDPFEIINGVKVGWGCGNGQAPIGAYCTVAAATEKNLTISVKIIFANGINKDTVKAEIAKNIKSYLKEIAFEQNYVSVAKIGNAIIDTDGVLDYSQLTVNGGISNISVSDTATNSEVAILQTLTIIE